MSGSERSARAKGAVWTPTLTVAPARGTALFALLGACSGAAALVVYRWVRGHEDPFVNAVLLVVIAWIAVAGVVVGQPRRYLLAATPYALALVTLLTLTVLQLTGDPGDVRQSNALLAAYLTLPLVYLMFFFFRRPSEALRGTVVTCALAVLLQFALPPAVVGRATERAWVGLITAVSHGTLILLFYTVPRLRSDRDLLEAVIRSSRDAVVLVAPRQEEAGDQPSHAPYAFRVVFANDAAERAFGVQAGEGLTTVGPLSEAVELRARLTEAQRRSSEVRLSVSLPTHEGPRWFRVTAAPFRSGLAVTFADITEHKETETQALVLANTDPLTGLANRRGFEEEATRRLTTAANEGASAALCYLDLNGFKAVNDSFGHEAGDDLLRHVAERLRTAVRGTDLVGRVGGDEFVILAEDLDEEACEAFFERVRAAVDAPFSVSGKRLEVSSSLGVVTRARSLQTAMASADAAMYRAKRRGGGIEVYRRPS